MRFGESFIRKPDLFDEDPGLGPWGQRSAIIRCAGGPYSVAGLSAGQLDEAREHFGGACEDLAQESLNGVACQVRRAPEGSFREGHPRNRTYSLDLAYEPSAVRIAGMGFAAELRFAPRLGGTLWTSAEDSAFRGVLENLLRVLVSYRLVELGGSVLHSAGVEDRDRALVFYGHSTAGKTTISRLALAAGRRVLSDDLNALVPGDAAPVVEALHFAGELRGHCDPRGTLPLGALCHLRKDTATHLEPMGLASATATLLSCSPTVNQDPHRCQRLTANLEALAAATPCYTLSFALDDDVWGLLTRELGR